MKKYLFATAFVIFTLSQLSAQDVLVPMIGSKAPSFTANSTNGKINFPADYGKNWKILFSHPKDFTPVCSSEMLELAYDQKSFDELGVKLAVLSTDILEQHNSWKSALEEIHYKDRDPVKINFPLIADNDLTVSKLYGMIQSPESISKNIRGVYFIDPDNNIRAIMFYPNEVGRNIEELKRTVIALQSNYAHRDTVTPANWQKGDDVIIPVLSQSDKDNLDSPDSDYYQMSWFLTFKKSDK
jgi:peroxiredoxin (alkyl hydroperoxide reductase subunit C)